MPTYSLDVAFSSDNQPYVSTRYIVMSYAYVNDNDGLGQGQIVEIVPPGAVFEFAVFDTAARACTITQVQIDFTTSSTPFLDDKGAAVGSPITITTGLQGATGNSIGCNVSNAMRWVVAGYTIASDIANGTEYNFSIVVTATDRGGNVKTFGVDPEMIVEGTG